MRYLYVLLALVTSSLAHAQVDTINTATLKLNLSAFNDSKRSYAVFFEDSTGKRLTSADIWDRTIRLSQTPSGQKIYEFDWKWFQKDSLLGHVTATGQLPSLAPLTHKADYAKRGKLSTVFSGNNVAVSMPSRKTGKDTTFNVTLKSPAFEFPMDLEILPLLPIKKVGQQFAVAFYEPGTPAASYYRLTVTGKDNLPIGGNTKINCWLLKIDYGRPDAHATFWISDQSREVIKMREYFRGRYRYKVKLF